MKYTILLIAVMSILSCSPSPIIGYYTNTNTSKMAFAGKELTLRADQTFTLNEWSDNYSKTTNENGEIDCPGKKGKGSGTYRIQNDSIELHFTNNDFITCISHIIDNDDSFLIEVEIKDEMNQPLIGSIVALLKTKHAVIENQLTNDKRLAIFEISKSEKPKFIHIGIFGIQNLSIDIEKNIGKRIFKLKRCLGYYKNGQRIKIWFKASKNHITYQKKNGRKVKLNRIGVVH